MRRIEVKVEGTVAGFARFDETDEQAEARLVLQAETQSNEKGSQRLHLSIKQVLIPVGGRTTASNHLAKEIATLLQKNGIEDVDAPPLAVDVLALVQNYSDITNNLMIAELEEAYANADLCAADQFRLYGLICQLKQLQCSKTIAKETLDACGQLLKELSDSYNLERQSQ